MVMGMQLLVKASARWETALLSPALEDQLWAVQQAEDAARTQELLAVT